jgi:DNA-binding HxlR family transcriptional regulator
MPQKRNPCGPACDKIEKKPGCIQAALGILGDKWSPLLIARLVGASHTFMELEELLPGISPRTLSQRLEHLHIEGIITQEKYCAHPVRYRYKLTKKGTELRVVLIQMAAWGEQYSSKN